MLCALCCWCCCSGRAGPNLCCRCSLDGAGCSSVDGRCSDEPAANTSAVVSAGGAGDLGAAFGIVDTAAARAVASVSAPVASEAAAIGVAAPEGCALRGDVCGEAIAAATAAADGAAVPRSEGSAAAAARVAEADEGTTPGLFSRQPGPTAVQWSRLRSLRGVQGGSSRAGWFAAAAPPGSVPEAVVRTASAVAYMFAASASAAFDVIGCRDDRCGLKLTGTPWQVNSWARKPCEEAPSPW